MYEKNVYPPTKSPKYPSKQKRREISMNQCIEQRIMEIADEQGVDYDTAELLFRDEIIEHYGLEDDEIDVAETMYLADHGED